jgi:hypothetical protein
MPLPVCKALPTESRWFWFRDGIELVALRAIFGEGSMRPWGTAIRGSSSTSEARFAAALPDDP